jgi:hypothetical protein
MQATSAKLLYPLRHHLSGTLGSSISRQLNPTRKRHIVPGLSVSEFLHRLNERDVAYVVLTSAGRSPEELEVLVGDDDLDKINDLITLWPVGTPLQIYTASARPGTAYYPPNAPRLPSYRAALLPPLLANQLLDRAISAPDGAKVLTDRDTFLLTAYRAAYLGATCCEWALSQRCKRCKEYEAELRRLANVAGFELPEIVTPVVLDSILNDEGWRPPFDMLEKATQWAPWVKTAFPELAHGKGAEPPGVATFFIRERAVENGLKSEIIETLREKGFEPLLVLDLDEQQREVAGQTFRGGNWGASSWKVSGGRPACVVVGLDLLPLPVEGPLASEFPDCDNLKILRAKNAARDLVNADLSEREQYNGVHSTDNTAQSWRAIRLLAPEQEEPLRREIEEHRSAFKTDGVIRDLTRYGSRARVALVEFEGKLAIRKTFRPNALRYMEREAEVMETLAPICPEIPKLLARGENHIIVEYLGEGQPPPPWPHALPLKIVRQLARFIKTCVANGFDPIDMKPRGNVLLTQSGLKVIDYEFWRRCDPSTLPEKSYCLAGLPRDYTGDRPRGVLFLFNPYPTQWFRLTALPVESFLYDPAWLQYLKRSVHLAGRYARWGVNGAARRLILRPLSRLTRALLT